MRSVRRRVGSGALVSLAAAAFAVVIPLAGTASAAPGLVQTATGSSPPSVFGSGASASATWASPTTAGNLLLLTVHVNWLSGFPSPISVPAGWVPITQVDKGNSLRTAMFYRENAPSESGSVTVSVPTSVWALDVILAEYAGVAHSISLDQHASNSGYGTPASTGTTAPVTQPNTLWVAAIGLSSDEYACQPTNGFRRSAFVPNAEATVTLFDRTDTTTGSASMSASIREGSSCNGQLINENWTGIVATFRTTTSVCPSADPNVVACLTAGDVILHAALRTGTTGAPAVVAGYVDSYEFNVAGVRTTLPCVELVALALDVNPCALAGGTFVDRLAELIVSTDPSAPAPALVSVTICEASLSVTVLGLGVNSAPAYTLC